MGDLRGLSVLHPTRFVRSPCSPLHCVWPSALSTERVTLPPAAGTPATPRLVSPLGGKDGATFSFTAVPTAVKYTVTAFKEGTALSPARQGLGERPASRNWAVAVGRRRLGGIECALGTAVCQHPAANQRCICPADLTVCLSYPPTPAPACYRTVIDASIQQAWSLADLGGEPGQFTFSVVAENANKAPGEAANTSTLVVGSPGKPEWLATNPVVVASGTATLRWTAPAYNAKIGTAYYVQLWRDNGATKFGGLVALATSGAGTSAEPFAATLNVTSGVWSYQLLTNNTWGAGVSSEKTQVVEQAVADTPVIQSLTGGVTAATLRFLKPSNTNDQDTIIYRAQVGNGGAAQRLHNKCLGLAGLHCTATLPKLRLGRLPGGWTWQGHLRTEHASMRCMGRSAQPAQHTPFLRRSVCSCTMPLCPLPPSWETPWFST